MSRREFQFIDGSSKKFWAIQLEGNSFTVHYGRIGTAGQAQEKSFATEETAKREHDKLVAEKLKKGYAEVLTGESAAPGPIPAVAVKKPAAAPAANPMPAATADPAEAAIPQQPEAAPAKSAAGNAGEVPSPPAAAVKATLERSISLSRQDRWVVTWIEHPTLQKPAPLPFNLESCMERLSAVGTTIQIWQQDWRKAKVPDFPTPIEAQFWLLAFASCRDGDQTPQQVADRLADVAFDGKMPFADALECVRRSWRAPDNLFGCVAALASPEDLVLGNYSQREKMGFELAAQVRDFVFPYLTAEQRADFKKSLAGSVKPIIPSTTYEAFPASYYMGALFGCHEELLAVVRGLPDNHYEWTGKGGFPDYHQRPQWLVFGLGDAHTVESEFRRLAITLRDREQSAAWLALTEYAGLDVIASSTCAAKSKEDAAKAAAPLALVAAPEAAIPALQILRDSKAPQIGLEWLTRHPLHAAMGLVPAAMGQGKLAEAARERLGLMRHGEAAPMLNAAAGLLPPEQAAWLQSEILSAENDSAPEIARDALPPSLRASLDALKPLKAPGWLSIVALPPIKIGAGKLAMPDIECVLAALKATPAGTAAPVLSALKEAADRHSLDAFAWKLFDQWNGMGALSKDKWAMGGIAHLGGDGCALKLTPLIREWPGESQHQRAVFGLECLRGIGTDAALMALNGMALKLKFKALKEKAQAMMEGIAEARGFTREQLADRIVPDCGLDERGSRVFDFGPRQFHFALGPEMKPLVRDSAGKVRPDLPSPNSSDDAGKAESAVAEWKLFKKTLREVLKVQAERLEDAMITGRRWTPEEFSSLIVKHPLMVNLARQLVFAAFDDAGRVARSFRVTEDQTLADQNDEPADLPAAGGIGVVHPAHLDEGAKAAWGELLSDYETIPPFQQLGRAICRPEPEDMEQKEIKRYRGPKVPGIVMYGMLERSLWLRDTPADGGGFMQHSKYFPSANLTAFIQYDGLSISYYEEPQELKAIYFVPGHARPEMWGRHEKRFAIKDVDQVVMSEVLRLANAIVSKAS